MSQEQEVNQKNESQEQQLSSYQEGKREVGQLTWLLLQ